MKRIITLAMVLLLLVAVIALPACSAAPTTTAQPSETGTGTSATSAETTALTGNGETLTVMISSGDNENTAIKTALELAGAELNVKVEYNVFPSDQMLGLVNTKLATGNADDIIIHVFGLTDVSAKDLAPLTGDWVSKIRSNVLPICTDTESGNILKAPLGGASNMGLVYNKEVLAACGVELPLKNYAEFTAACEKIKAKGYTPVYVSNKEVWTAQILLLTSMTSIIAETPNMVTDLFSNKMKPSDNPALVKLWENVLALKTNGYINEDYMSATNSMGFEAIANGTAAFYAHLDGSYGEIKTAYPDKIANLGMTYCPMWDDEANGYVLFGSASNYLSVVNNSKNLELAKAFVNTMLSEKVMTAYYEISPGASPYNDIGFDLPMSPFNAEMAKYAESMAVYGDFNNNVYAEGALLEPFYGRFNEQVQNLFAGKTVAEAMEDWYNAYADDAEARGLAGFGG